MAPGHAVVTPHNPAFAPFTAVPGLGFDYPHLAAINRASLPHAHIGRNIPFVALIFNYALPLYYFDGSDLPYPQPQPSVIVVQQPSPTIVIEPAAPAVNPPSEAAAPPRDEPPLPELTQFILVRRDGQVQLAVAFAIAGDRLIYITRDGLRHTLSVAELDKDTTRQMNDVNGTTLVLPD